MDRNNLIGFLLIFLLLIGYTIYESQQPRPEPPKTTQATPAPKVAPSVSETITDSATAKRLYGDFAAAGFGEAKDIVVENKDVKITLNTKGGKIKEVLLKNYKTYDQKPLVLIDEKSSSRALRLPGKTGDINLSDLYFTSTDAGGVVKQDGDSIRVSFRLALADNQYVEQIYTIRGSGYQIGYDLKVNGLDGVLKNAPVQLVWLEHLKKFEKDTQTSQMASAINYYTVEEEFNDIGDNSVSVDEKAVEEPIRWVSLKQRFFLTALIARGTPFSSGQLKSSVPTVVSNDNIKVLESNLQLSLADLKSGKGHFDYYFGPNDYEIVKNVTDGFRENVYLGWPVIRIVSRFVILPVFHLLESFITNYGLLIIALVLVVKTILFPLVYRSYMSIAKTRVLQPEIEEIKAKHGDDMQKVQQEQMKLYNQVGVNPLSGCVPVLLQMPILFALFSLFPNLIEFRQKAFLWANDLSTYDSIIQLPFNIPFTAYSHISLFAVMMTASSLAFTYYNSQMTSSAAMPGPYKTVQYVMPVVIMFVLNSSPAGLNFYYLISNLVTIAQQLTIRKFVDEGEIRRKLEENRIKNKDKKKTGFQARLEEAMRKAEEVRKDADSKKGPNTDAKKKTKK
ncbi:membrane protein insertase YidC [Cytophagaceae bacterium DM2B3-1]|uniref:Membrane protein insertase YidC n=1 Tax=Xanthocytophaga flava TaxID=3048013 RepID=A0ABT7CP63_9BACT|nr:membrane protein insertase YidC [Xanthocytophaga flavus]MDJ1466285.1 membrane protein insertase YidC [Xanthocytophaga flavus]MDJ1495490.1 membrane protein insertase YidC [Xanthocytophaga flavus]